MDHLQRLRYVTERYEQLQGLRLVPLGIPFLLSSAWRGGHLNAVPWTTGIGPRIWFALLVAAGVGFSLFIKAYYARRFGDVQSVLTLEAPLAAFVFAALFMLAASVQPQVKAAVSMPAVIVALGLGYLGMVGGLLRPHYLMMAISVAAFAALGPLGVPYHARDVLWDQLMGIGFVVIGVGDHLLLRRTLVPVAPEVNGNAL
jgi:hypothetical protein